jgi:hypothetical protein
MKNPGKLLRIITIGVIMCVGLASCATANYTRTDPFGIGEARDRSSIVRVPSDGIVKFDEIKINGVTVNSNEFALPIAPSYEFKFRVRIIARGFFMTSKKIIGKSDVVYNFTPGKTYMVRAEETTGSRVADVLVGALAPANVKIVLYEYSSDLSQVTKVAEFPAVKLNKKDF